MCRTSGLRAVLLLGLMISLALTACTGGAPTNNNEGGPATKKTDLVIVMNEDITSFDPMSSSAIPNIITLPLIYDRLFDQDERLAGVPHLAKKAEAVSDTEWLISIHEGVKFSNGEEVTSTDVKASLDRACESGAAGVLLQPVESVEVVDKYTVKIVTSGLYPALTTALSHVTTCIMPASYIEKATASGDWSSPIGSGRYTVESRIPGESLTLKAVENYWNPGTAPQNSSLTFKVVPEASSRTIMVQTGEADLNVNFSTADYEIATTDSNLELYSLESNTMYYMVMDTQHDILSNKMVRQAFNYAIDREGVLVAGQDGHGVVNYTYLAPCCYGWLDNPSNYSYDVDKAKELLSQAGYPNGFELDMYTTSEFASAAAFIQSNLRDINVTLNIKMVESTQDYVKLATEGRLTSCVTRWGCFTEPDLVLQRLVGEKALGAYNHARFVNSELEELWPYGRFSLDLSERVPYYEAMQRILCEEAPWVQLYVRETYALARSDLQGVQLNIQNAYNFYSLHY
jgi:peptide/nickel transport system substrate-binding protein